MFGLSEMVPEDECQQSAKLFANLAEEKGSHWNLLLVVLEFEAQVFDV